MYIASIVFWGVFGIAGAIMFIYGLDSRRVTYWIIPGSVFFVGGFLVGMLGWAGWQVRNLRIHIAYMWHGMRTPPPPPAQASRQAPPAGGAGGPPGETG